MKYTFLIFTLLMVLVFPQITHAEEMVSVQLVNYVGETSTINFQYFGNYNAFDPSLKLEEGVSYSLHAKKGSLILKIGKKSFNLGESFVLYPTSYNYESFIFINDRPYLGAVEFRMVGKKEIRPVNQLPLEDYLKGVVPFEVFPQWGHETLKTQALAARTYAVSQIHKEINDTVSYQAYGGYLWNEKTTKAVNDTKGEVITFHNKLINAYYSASNGGITENNAHVWGGPALPVYPIKVDPYDPEHPWEFSLSKIQIALEDIDWNNPNWWIECKEKDKEITSSIKSWLARRGYPGEFKILGIPHFELSHEQLVSNRSTKGSITVQFMQLLFDGTVLFGEIEMNDVPLNQIRPMIGGNIFKSYLIDSFDEEDAVYTMKGKGYGHGVGMSQWGAHYMGENGKTYKEIIQFYFPGTTISNLY
jgi:stage II sporulation protein D